MISAVNIIISGMVFYGGMIMISTMTPIGVLAGAILVADGTNGITKEVNKFLSEGKSNSEGVVADKVINIAQFMGFKAKSGLAFYNTLTLSANIYSIVGLARKAGARRLFRWLPHDYYRKVNTMSRPKLTMKIVGYGIKAKVIFDLLSTEAPNH